MTLIEVLEVPEGFRGKEVEICTKIIELDLKNAGDNAPDMYSYKITVKLAEYYILEEYRYLYATKLNLVSLDI